MGYGWGLFEGNMFQGGEYGREEGTWFFIGEREGCLAKEWDPQALRFSVPFSSGAPCPQPRQLTTKDLPPCVSMTVYDYFEGSGPGFGITIVALCCLPLGETFTSSPIYFFLAAPSPQTAPAISSPRPTSPSPRRPITCWPAGLAPGSGALKRVGSSQSLSEATGNRLPSLLTPLIPFSESAYLWGGGPSPGPRT